VLTRSDGLIIGQPAHAWVSGQLARAWGGAAFPAPVPREPVCLAAEQHDVGWADADLAPLRAPEGAPLSFLQYPRTEHVAIWRAAPSRLLAQSRYAALLVSLHGTSLYERVDPGRYEPAVATAIRDYMRDQRDLQARLAAGLDPDEVDRNRRLILAWDRFSLALCHGDATRLEDVPAADGTATIHVDPLADAPSPSAPAPPASSSAPPVSSPAAAAVVRDDRAVAEGAVTAAYAVDPWPFAAERVVVGCEARALDGEPATPEALVGAAWVPLRWVLSPR
jgi:Protein of unknown function (DUF3891)